MVKNLDKQIESGESNIQLEVLPSGISAAMTATSASNHRQYLTNTGYSALHNSDKCFPVKKKKEERINYKTIVNYI